MLKKHKAYPNPTVFPIAYSKGIVPVSPKATYTIIITIGIPINIIRLAKDMQ